ncbi:MAG: TonB-dependent receptor [Bacteroidales bacterium]|nr:TonB-dependent receptor [Bacteroidales bacterium]
MKLFLIRSTTLLTLAFISCPMWADPRTVSGRVTDTQGEPLAGAHVSANGLRDIATTTDADGNYAIEVLPGTVRLKVSYVGYVPQTIAIADVRELMRCDVRLAEDQTSLDQVVVTATKTAKTLKDVPVVARLISSDDIRKADATNIQDMLTQELPGLEFGFAMSHETSLNMGGFGGNGVLFLVDGERMAGETMDNTDYNRLNLDNIARIEIIKGAASALYGSNAVGGVVNLISRENSQPWTATLNSRYATEGDSWRNGMSFSANRGRWNWHTDVQQTSIDPIRFNTGPSAEEKALAQLLGLTLEEDKSDITQLYGNRTLNVKQKIGCKASDKMKIVARGGYFYRESLRDTYEYHYNAYSGGLRGEYDWHDGRRLEASLAYDQYDKANYLPDGTRTHDHDYSNRQSVGHITYHHSIGENALTVGGDVMHDYLTTYQFVGNDSHRQTNVDAYAQFDYNPSKRFNVVASARYDRFSASDVQAVTGRVAAIYKWDRISLRANYAGGFRAPSLKEMYMHFVTDGMPYITIGNSDLKPERSHNFSAAIEHYGRIQSGTMLDGSYNLTAMGYCNRLDKRIGTLEKRWVTDSSHSDGGFLVDADDEGIATGTSGSLTYTTADGTVLPAQAALLYWNDEGVTVSGIDLSAQYRLDIGLGLRFNYAYMHQTGGVLDVYLTQPRTHSMTWRIDYDRQFVRHYGICATLSGRCLGRAQSAQTNIDPGYTLWKLMLQQRIWRGITVNFTVDNLFDFTPQYYFFSSPMTTGRSYAVGLTLDIERMLE